MSNICRLPNQSQTPKAFLKCGSRIRMQTTMERRQTSISRHRPMRRALSTSTGLIGHRGASAGSLMVLRNGQPPKTFPPSPELGFGTTGPMVTRVGVQDLRRRMPCLGFLTLGCTSIPLTTSSGFGYTRKKTSLDSKIRVSR
jgi:hypothetical protein